MNKKSAQIILQPSDTDGYNPPGHKTISIHRALPFYKSRRGKYVHRVRKGKGHFIDGKLHHASFDMWCGAGGFAEKGHLLAEPREGDVVCATCEGRAVGAGLIGPREINGVPVRYSPIKSP